MNAVNAVPTFLKLEKPNATTLLLNGLNAVTRKSRISRKCAGCSGTRRILHRLVQQEWFSDVFDFGNGAFEVEGFGEDDFEDLVGGVSEGKGLASMGERDTFWTLMLWLVLLKMRLAFMAFAKRFACRC